MNQEIKNKINLISEMMSIYQTTVVNETDNENIKLIKKDVTNKRSELEDIKKELNIELNRLYDNGSNEIDPEINQMRIIINEVNNLIEEIVPDILSYLQSTNFEIKIENNVQNLFKEDAIVKTPILENQPKIEENISKIEPIKNELQLEEVKDVEKEILEKDSKQDKDKNKIEIAQDGLAKDVEENIEVLKKNIEDEKKDEKIVETQKEIIEIKKIEDNQQIKEVKDIVIQKPVIKKETKNKYTIKIKQPTEDYLNTANNIILNRMKNINSPENAAKKSYNAAEIVMNNIIQTWSE